jgi:hypothetical protein
MVALQQSGLSEATAAAAAPNSPQLLLAVTVDALLEQPDAPAVSTEAVADFEQPDAPAVCVEAAADCEQPLCAVFTEAVVALVEHDAFVPAVSIPFQDAITALTAALQQSALPAVTVAAIPRHTSSQLAPAVTAAAVSLQDPAPASAALAALEQEDVPAVLASAVSAEAVAADAASLSQATSCPASAM